MASLASLARKYDPNNPDYDPSILPPDPLAQTQPTPVAQPALAPPTTPAQPPPDLTGNALATRALTDANKVNPYTQQYNEATGVAGRVNSLVAGGGPLMQTARTQAAQTSAQRGLLNSSLGVQAGEQAVINTATPIATADAQMTSQQNLANQNAINSASTTNSTLAVQAGTAGLTLDQAQKQFETTTAKDREQFTANLQLQRDQVDAQISQFAQNMGITVQELNLRRDTLTAQQQQQLDQLNLQRSQLSQQQTQFESSQAQAMALANMDVASRTNLAQIEAQYRTEIQASTNVANAWGTMMQGIQQIQNNPQLDSSTRRQLIQNTTDGFASFAQFWRGTSGVDVGPLLQFQVVNAGNGAGPNDTQVPAYNRPGPGYVDETPGGGG